jgi:hypothetical protein
MIFTNILNFSIFCGHDHDNDFTINLYGIRLSFGRIGGYNTYGDLQRGARLIELQPDAIYKAIAV